MKVVTIGGGPAGLYLAILLKKANPDHQVTVLERNGPVDAFGWGVVTDSFAQWDDIDILFLGTTVTSGGHGFSGIARKKLLNILQERATSLGVELQFHCEIRDDAELGALGLADADLIVAADGINSLIRKKYARHFRPDLDVRSARFTRLGTTRLCDAFTFIFVENEHGVFQSHAYRFDEGHSAFIVECDEQSWRNAGSDMLEVHCAHGYLLSSFITPVSNQRTDEYAGSLENRLRLPVEVFAAMRNVWPEERPMSVRISATDWMEEGIQGDHAVAVARAFAAVGVDIIHVSTGQTSPDAKPVYGRMFQTPYSDRIRNEAGIPTIAVGNITEADQVNGIIAAERGPVRARSSAPARPELDASRGRRAGLHRPALARSVPDRQKAARTQSPAPG